MPRGYRLIDGKPTHCGGRPGEIPVGPIREAVLARIEAGDTWSGIARRAGWPHSKGKPNSGCGTTLKRRLGMVHMGGLKQQGKFTEAMQYETALRICKAIEVDPVDVGL